jgi:hypothetical protein
VLAARALRPLDHSHGLPALADVIVGIYLRDGKKTEELEKLAACFADLFVNFRSSVA